MVETINRLIRVSRTLLQELGREPTGEEIGRRQAWTAHAEKVREIMKVSQEPVASRRRSARRRTATSATSSRTTRPWRRPTPRAHQLLKEQVEGVLDSLTPRERRVLQLRFGLEDGRSRTLEEVGRDFNVTRERIRQIEAKALRKLRHPSRSRKLKDYLE